MAASPLLVWRIKAPCKMPPVWWAALAQRCIVIAPSSPISIPSSACTFRRLAASTRHLCKWPTTVARTGPDRKPQTESAATYGICGICISICIRIEDATRSSAAVRQSTLGPTADVVVIVAVERRLQLTIVLPTAVHVLGSPTYVAGSRHPVANWLRFVIKFNMISCFLSALLFFLSQAQIHHWQLEDQSGLSHARANHFNREVQDLGRWGKLPLKRCKAWNGYANYEIRILNKENTMCAVRTGNALIWILIRTENIYINIQKTKRKGENAKCLRRYSLSLI